jgi:hypothetical protein
VRGVYRLGLAAVVASVKSSFMRASSSGLHKYLISSTGASSGCDDVEVDLKGSYYARYEGAEALNKV